MVGAVSKLVLLQARDTEFASKGLRGLTHVAATEGIGEALLNGDDGFQELWAEAAHDGELLHGSLGLHEVDEEGGHLFVKE